MIALYLMISLPRFGLWVTGFLSIIFPLLIWRQWPGKRPGWLAIISLLFLLSSGAAVSVISLAIWQYVILAASGIFFAAVLTIRRDPDDVLAGRLINVVAALTVFFGWITFLSFGIGIFFIWPWWWLAISGALLTGAMSVIIWQTSGVPWHVSRRHLWLAVILGFEIMLATWWLPTVVFVGGILAATLVTLWAQTLRHIWLQTWEPGRGRRYLTVGLSIIMAVLITARWV